MIYSIKRLPTEIWSERIDLLFSINNGNKFIETQISILNKDKKLFKLSEFRIYKKVMQEELNNE